MDYSNSRLSSPEQPGEGEMHLNLNTLSLIYIHTHSHVKNTYQNHVNIILHWFWCVLDSEPTEPLSVDGNSSELDMEDLEEEEEESMRKTETCSSVPQTPDKEAFLKNNFSSLSDFSTSGLC